MENNNLNGFSSEWDACYSDNRQMSVWPWSDLVSLVNRYCKNLLISGGRVLELGCGPGANIPFFLKYGIDYSAIEGSATIVDQLHHRYPSIEKQIYLGDFTRNLFSLNGLDLIIDRASLTHNNTASIRRALEASWNALKPGGYYIGIDWFSGEHSDLSTGELIDDNNTVTKIKEGSFSGIGKVHFSDEIHLNDLFSRFEIILLEQKLKKRFMPADGHQFAAWNIVARRPLE